MVRVYNDWPATEQRRFADLPVYTSVEGWDTRISYSGSHYDLSAVELRVGHTRGSMLLAIRMLNTGHLVRVIYREGERRGETGSPPPRLLHEEVWLDGYGFRYGGLEERLVDSILESLDDGGREIRPPSHHSGPQR